MGWLMYGRLAIQIEDRTLLHLQVVIDQKLRYDEGFVLRWRIPPVEGSGRYSLWCSRNIPLAFDYERYDSLSVNRAWVQQLLEASYISAGVILVDEPVVTATATETHAALKVGG
jgi:hypothetical protein